MSGTSPFLRRISWANSDRKIPICTPSKIKVCEFERLIREQDKILSTKESALENNFLFISFLTESIWYVGFREGWCFGSSCFVADWLIKLLVYTEAGTRTNCCISRQMVNDSRSNNFIECKPLSDARSLFFASKLYVSQTIVELRFEILPRDVFLCFAGFIWADLLCILKETR